MIFRDGFVTNSSSTNFLIISKEELTEDYLFDRLGFQRGTPLEPYARELCADVICAASGDLRYYGKKEINFETISEVFGQKSAQVYEERIKEGFHSYMGHTSSDQGQLTSYFTCDFVEIDKEDFYLNGLNYIW